MGVLHDDLMTPGVFGAEGGVTRLARTRERRDTHAWLKGLKGRRGELGLDAEIDTAGNLVDRWDAGAGRAVVVAWHSTRSRAAVAATATSG